MVTLVGGIIALIVGLLGLVLWWDPFIIVLKAGIPIVFILGGALATYLGVEEWKDSQSVAAQQAYTPDPEAERYKAEAEKYKAELQAMKSEQPEGEESGETSES